MLSGLAEELKASDDAAVRALGEVLSGLVDALKWLTDEANWGTIKAGLEGLITLWAVGNAGKAAANIAAFAANLNIIRNGGNIFGSMFNGGTSAAASAASSSGGGGGSFGGGFGGGSR